MNYAFQEAIIPLACPICRLALNDDLTCTQCGARYSKKNDIPLLARPSVIKTALQDEQQNLDNVLKNYVKRWPRIYEWCIRLIAPVLFTGLSAKTFLRRFSKTGLFLNIGSGPTRLTSNTLNVDLFPFANVDIVSEASSLPFLDHTFDAACSEQVLEHVPNPKHVVDEMIRVVKKGGFIYTAVPFVFPYHPSPKDYTRFSIDGLRVLFEGLDEVESGVLCGPISGTLIVLAAGLATICSFGLTPLQKILNYFFMLILSPLKLLDVLYARLPGAEISAAGVYLVMQKPMTPPTSSEQS